MGCPGPGAAALCAERRGQAGTPAPRREAPQPPSHTGLRSRVPAGAGGGDVGELSHQAPGSPWGPGSQGGRGGDTRQGWQGPQPPRWTQEDAGGRGGDTRPPCGSTEGATGPGVPLLVCCAGSSTCSLLAAGGSGGRGGVQASEECVKNVLFLN